MRKLNMTRHEATEIVRKKRAVIRPNSAFVEQLNVWERCKFDLQNRVMVDPKSDSDTGSVSCTTQGEERKGEGGEEAKEGEKRTQQEEEVAPPSPAPEVVRAAIIPLCLIPHHGQEKIGPHPQRRSGLEHRKQRVSVAP